MRRLEHALSPCPQEFAVGVKGHNRHSVVAMKHVNIVVCVHIHASGRAPMGNAGRKVGPILDYLIVTLGRSQGYCSRKYNDHGRNGRDIQLRSESAFHALLENSPSMAREPARNKRVDYPATILPNEDRCRLRTKM